MKKLYLDLFRLWVRSYFKHPLENIRQANPIIPNRIYHNFGNACKAVPLSSAELKYISESSKYHALPPCLLKDIDKSGNGLHSIRELQQHCGEDGIPVRCNFCDFHKNGVPCPVCNVLKDGSTVCDTHKYIIIKPA